MWLSFRPRYPTNSAVCPAQWSVRSVSVDPRSLGGPHRASLAGGGRNLRRGQLPTSLQGPGER
eukprot:scaffold1541_cov418-Prasinococcus_capsulatus_cf.AAC.8